MVSQRTLGNALGTGAVSVAAGSRLSIVDHAGGVASLVNNFTLNGSGIGGNGALNFFNSGFNTANTGLTGTVNLAGNTTVRIDSNNQSGPIDFRGVISGVGSLTLFNQTAAAGTNPAIFKFDAANTYGTGNQNTVLTSSAAASSPMVVELGVANALPTATTVTFGGTPTNATGSFNKNVTLRLDGISQQVAGIQIASGATGTYIVAGNSATLSTLVVANTAPDTFSGTIGGAGTNNNNIALTVNGPNTLTLTGANTYTGGTTVNAGTLSLGSNAADGTGTLTVNSGGTTTVTAGNALGGGNVTLAGGTLQNGNLTGTTLANKQTSAILSLTTGTASILDFGAGNTGGTFSFTGLDGTNTGTLLVQNWMGNPDVGNGLDQFIVGGTLLTPTQLSQITFNIGGTTFGAAQVASTGEVVATAPAAAPEPSQYAAFAIGLLGLGALALKARKRSLAV